MGLGIAVIDLAVNWRPKEGLTIFESLENIICIFFPFRNFTEIRWQSSILSSAEQVQMHTAVNSVLEFQAKFLKSNVWNPLILAILLYHVAP